jgi:hypothetical protein
MPPTGALNAAVRGETDAAAIALRTEVNSLDDLAKAEMRAAAADARLGRSLAGPNAITRMKNAFGGMVSRIRGAGGSTVAAETRAAANKAASLEAEGLSKSAGTVRAEAQELRTASSSEKLTKASAKAEAKGISSTTYLAGIAGITLVSLSLASWMSTDGARLNINKMSIINTTNGPIVKVEYDVASVNDGGLMSNFGLRVGDYVEFDQPTPTVPNLSGDQQVVAVEGDHVFYIKPSPMLQTAGGIGIISGVPSPSPVSGAPSGSPMAGAPYGSPAADSPYGSSFWHQATVHSSFTNQMTGQLGDGISVIGAALGTTAAAVAGAAANAAAITINALTPAGTQIIGAAANAAGSAFHAVSPALGGVFCDIVPFLCNSTIWWSLLVLCICIFVIGIALKLKK